MQLYDLGKKLEMRSLVSENKNQENLSAFQLVTGLYNNCKSVVAQPEPI